MDEIGPDEEPSGRRVSRKGFVSLSLTRYLELLDWVGRQVRSDKRGSIPQSLAPILQRLGWNAQSLLESLVGFGAPPGDCWNEVACESDLQTATSAMI